MSTALRPIPGYDGVYLVSAAGKIYKRARCWRTGKDGKIHRSSPARWLRDWPTSNGYRIITLHLHGLRRAYFVHRLVALAWIPNPRTLPQINHINGIKTDNRAKNLEWTTAKSNKRHAVAMGLCHWDSPAFLASVRRNAVIARKAKEERACQRS